MKALAIVLMALLLGCGGEASIEDRNEAAGVASPGDSENDCTVIITGEGDNDVNQNCGDGQIGDDNDSDDDTTNTTTNPPT